MPLKVTLKPRERFVLNGGVLVNGNRRTDLIIENQVSLLRERDILHPEEANTPTRRIYFAIMMMYLEEALDSPFYQEFVDRITEFMCVVTRKEILGKCHQILDDVHEQRFYSALMTCKTMLPFEKERLENV